VRSLEPNDEWYARLAGRVGSNVELSHVGLGELETAQIDYRGEEWVVVDFAGRRTRFLHDFLLKVPRGSHPPAIILDNADWYRRGAAVLTQHGYLELPFFGFKSGQVWISCTSLFIDPNRFACKMRAPFAPPPFSRQLANAWDAID
jgi:hypothetical protein